MVRGGLGTMLAVCAPLFASGSPLENESLLLAPPSDFRVGYQKTLPREVMTEWVPDGETVEEWTEMLTVQIYRGATVTAPDFLRGVADRYINDCRGTDTGKGMHTGQVNGYVVSMLVLMCPNNPRTGKPETTAFRFIKGADALYAVQYAWRKVPSAAEMDAAMHVLAKVTVCDTRAPLEHPCPPTS
jgi:hypothetical protein